MAHSHENWTRTFNEFRKSTIGQSLGYKVSLWMIQAWQYTVEIQFLGLSEKN